MSPFPVRVLANSTLRPRVSEPVRVAELGSYSASAGTTKPSAALGPKNARTAYVPTPSGWPPGSVTAPSRAWPPAPVTRDTVTAGPVAGVSLKITL